MMLDIICVSFICLSVTYSYFVPINSLSTCPLSQRCVGVLYILRDQPFGYDMNHK